MRAVKLNNLIIFFIYHCIQRQCQLFHWSIQINLFRLQKRNSIEHCGFNLGLHVLHCDLMICLCVCKANNKWMSLAFQKNMHFGWLGSFTDWLKRPSAQEFLKKKYGWMIFNAHQSCANGFYISSWILWIKINLFVWKMEKKK